LEELTLKVTIEDQPTSTYEDRCFSLKGLKLQGAVSEGNKLRLTSAMMTDLSLTRLRWTRVQGAQQVEAGTVTLPVYLNANRTEILFTVDINVDNPEKKLSFYERGVALFATSLF
jgi:dynein heavy chain 1